MQKTLAFIFVALLAGCTAYEQGGTHGIGRGEADESEATDPGDATATPGTIPSTGPVPAGCVRIEGDDIGQVGRVVTVGGVDIEIVAWTPKDGEDGELVGFQLAPGANVAFAVKTGGETHQAEGTAWVHPAGTKGPEVPAISNVTFCPADPGDESDDDFEDEDDLHPNG
jgi:hypothetical protein